MSFDSLYPDVKKHIFSFIDLGSLGRMCQVSKEMKDLIYDENEDLRVEKYIESFIFDQEKFFHWRRIMSDPEAILLECCKTGRPLVVIEYLITRLLIAVGLTPLFIMSASRSGHVQVVKLLLSDKRVDPSAGDNRAIKNASINGHVEVVKVLLSDPRVDPSAGNNDAIRRASENGHVEVVKLLLNDSRVKKSYTP
jgi:hypothetical protein